MKEKIKIRFVVENVLFSIIATSTAYIASVILLCFSFYVHEFGHILFGFIDNILHLKFALPRISNYVNCTILPVPQQTINISPSLMFALGGVAFAILFFLTVAHYFSKKLKKYTVFFYLVAFTFVIREIFGNIIFGTDNFIGKPLLEANAYPLLSSITESMFGIRILIISVIIILILREKVPYKKVLKRK